MKILMISSDFPPDIGGIASHVYELSKALIKKGHSVTLFSILKKDSHLKDEMSNKDGIIIHRINRTIKLGHFSIKAGRYRLKRYLKRLTQSQTFDVVHIHIHGHTWETYVIQNISLPVVATFHSNQFKEKMKNWLNKKRLCRLSRATAPSKQLCELVNQFHLPLGLCTFIPNGVDTARFKNSKLSFQWPFDVNKNKIILCACRIARAKGIIYLVKALPKIIEQYPNIILVLAGPENPTYRKEIQNYIQQNSLEKYCIFLGSVPNTQMPNLMQCADVSILPSLREATSITALESMAMGLPIVATTVGGLPELITHQEHGLLVPPEDPTALAEAIINLLSNPNLAHNLGQAALKRVRTEFDWSQIAQRFENVYQSML